MRIPVLAARCAPFFVLMGTATCSNPAGRGRSHPPADVPSSPSPEASPTRRVVIRTAHLRLEADHPAELQRLATAIAEELGGFVVLSQSDRSGAQAGPTAVELVLRVPAEHFSAALGRIRGHAGRTLDEQLAGQDVTEEYVDLEAALRAKRALEGRLLQILKEAHTVKDTLDIETSLGAVDGEIEKLEGRRRLLENQSALSTITLQIERAGGLGLGELGVARSLREASIELARATATIFVGVVRASAWLIPTVILIGGPIVVAARLARRLRRSLRP